MEGFGKPSYGGNKSQSNDSGPKENKVYFKNLYFRAGKGGAPEGPKIVFRIMPPMKSLASDGWGWRRKIGDHWGHVLPTNNPDKNRPLVFACIEQRDFNSKQLIVSCPKCVQMAEVEARYEEMKNVLKAQNKTEQEIFDITENDYQFLEDHRLRRQWNVNVMLEDGTFGVLKMSSKTFNEKLKPLIESLLKKENVDAIDYEQGVWFEGYRQGHGRGNAVDIISVVRETVEVPGYGKLDRIKKAPLSETQLKEALKILPDLATETVFHLSAQQIQLLVEGSNDPEGNKTVLALGQKTDAPPKTVSGKSAATPSPTPKVASAPLGKNTESEEKFLRELLEE